MQTDTVALKRIVEKVRDLPSLPKVVMRVLSLAQDPNTSGSDMENLLLQDPSLTVRIMRVANSSFYGYGDIKTLKEAILILGFPAIRSIIFCTSVFETFPGVGRPGFDRGEFWRHSLAVAVAARLIAVRQRFPVVEEAFIAGLIHDIGKIILDEYLSDSWQAALTYAADKKVLIFEVERAVFGCSHAQVGRWLATRWNLPAHYNAAIFYHHHPSFAGSGETLVSFIHVSDILVRMLKLGWSGDPLIPPLDPDGLERSGLKDSDMKAICESLPDAFAKAENSFPIPSQRHLKFGQD